MARHASSRFHVNFERQDPPPQGKGQRKRKETDKIRAGKHEKVQREKAKETRKLQKSKRSHTQKPDENVPTANPIGPVGPSQSVVSSNTADTLGSTRGSDPPSLPTSTFISTERQVGSVSVEYSHPHMLQSSLTPSQAWSSPHTSSEHHNSMGVDLYPPEHGWLGSAASQSLWPSSDVFDSDATGNAIGNAGLGSRVGHEDEYDGVGPSAAQSITQDAMGLEQPHLLPPTVSSDLLAPPRMNTPCRQLMPQLRALYRPPQGYASLPVVNSAVQPGVAGSLGTLKGHMTADEQLARSAHADNSQSGHRHGGLQLIDCSSDSDSGSDESGSSKFSSSNSDSSSDSDTDTSESESDSAHISRAGSKRKKLSASGKSKTKSKKRGKNRRITRTGQLTDRIAARITEEAFPFMRTQFVTQHAFPDESQLYKFCRESYAAAYEKLQKCGVDLGAASKHPSLDSCVLLKARGAQTRGDVKDTVRAIFTRFYSFISCHPKNTPIVNQNRELCARLITEDENVYVYKNCDVNSEGTLYRNSAILHSICATWFRDENSIGVKFRESFEDDGGLRFEVIALVATALHYCIDEWKAGYRVGSRQGIKFSDKAYSSIYEKHLKTLHEWVEYTKDVSKDDAPAKLQRELLADALEHAGISVVVANSSLPRLQNHIFARNAGLSA